MHATKMRLGRRGSVFTAWMVAATHIFATAACTHATDGPRISERLPVAPPRVQIDAGQGWVPSSEQPTGDFADLRVSPRSDGVPRNLKEAITEFEALLPSSFADRLAAYFGQRTDDRDVDERLYDMYEFLIDRWKLSGGSVLSTQFRCLGMFEGDLSRFIYVWVASRDQLHEGRTATVLHPTAQQKVNEAMNRLQTKCGLPGH